MNMELIKQDIGVWVKAIEEKPEANILLNLKFDGRQCVGVYWIEEKEEDNRFFVNYISRYYKADFDKIEWLKPVKQVYVLTESQLNEIENKAYKEGRSSVSKADFNYD